MRRFESFEWAKKIEDLPQGRLLKIVAKTTAPTIHPEDPVFPVREFAETELMKNARSLIGRPIGLNHQTMPIYGAYAVDADWNEAQKQLEAIAFVPEEYIKKVEEGLIKTASIEYTWRDTKQTATGTEFIGLGITRVDLVEGMQAGDPNAIVSLFETVEKRGVILAEIMPPKKLGEPFAGYADFAACVAANQDKDNPEAYCGAIKAKTESGILFITKCQKDGCEYVFDSETDPSKRTCPKCGGSCSWFQGNEPPTNLSVEAAVSPPLPAAPTPESQKRTEELEAAVTRLSSQIKDLESSKAGDIEKARKEAIREIKAKVRDAMGPPNFMLFGRRPNPPLIEMRKSINKVLIDNEPPK